MTKPNPGTSPGKALAYMRLIRLPNVFTAVADIAAGYLLVHPSLTPIPAFALLVLASCMLYSAGMVLNDVYDLEVDRRERPERPLPSRAIDARWARTLGLGLLASGVATAAVTGLPVMGDAYLPWRPGLIATALAVCVWLYDSGLKKTPAGPICMGACRSLNVLLGAATAAFVVDAAGGRLGYGLAELTVAAAMGLYITGVTMFARTEARRSSRPALCTSMMVMLLGIVLLSTFPNRLDRALLEANKSIAPTLLSSYWLLLLGLLAFPIVWRCLRAIVDPSPVNVQMAVKNAVLSLILLDAAVVLQMGGIPYAVGVVALVVPAMTLGRWVYST